jgi:MFS family permease
MEVSKQSWLELVRSTGLRRRFFVTIFIGLFTQLSGNTLLSYYSGKLFDMMGYKSQSQKTRINLAYACWSLINATVIALFVTRFKRRHMYMLSCCLMLLTFIAMTVTLAKLQDAEDAGVKNYPAGAASLFFYFAYAPTYNIGNNALTYTYLIELWPYSHRSRGIGVQQFFGKLAGFFSTNVNSIALDAIKWKYLAIYCGWIFFEFCIVYLLYPETSGRTLEELAFMFEDETLNEKTVAAVEKQIHYGDNPEATKSESNPVTVQTKELA